MKTVQLLHNPTAGDMENSGEELVALVEAAGYECLYATTDEDVWKNLHSDADILAVAGGDGTLRKTAMAILKRELGGESTSPIAFIPSGTANNLGKSLGLMYEPRELIASWETGNIKSFDVGRIKGCQGRPYFLEGFGFGIFPILMNRMEQMEISDEMPAEEELQLALEQLLKVIREHEAHECKLVVDGMDHSGKFLLVEIMNINSIGPNLDLNPLADPGDGEFEIIIIPADQRARLETFVQNKIDGVEENLTFSALKGRDISIAWSGKYGHADDEVVTAEKGFDISVQVHPGVLSLLVPEDS